MRIVFRKPKKFFQPVGQVVVPDMLQLLGHLMHLVPVIPELIVQEDFP